MAVKSLIPCDNEQATDLSTELGGMTGNDNYERRQVHDSPSIEDSFCSRLRRRSKFDNDVRSADQLGRRPGYRMGVGHGNRSDFRRPDAV